jgi:hypothetical protein
LELLHLSGGLSSTNFRSYGHDELGHENMRFGSALFWLATILAGLIVLWVALDFLFGLSGKFPVVDVTALEFAAVIWLIGFFCRRAF